MAMRTDQLMSALECDYIDAALLETPKGPRVVLRPHKKNVPISLAAFSLDLQAARMLSLHLQQFVQEAEVSQKSQGS